MKRFIALVFFLWSSVAFAQTPTPVLPGYQTCNTSSGSTVCGFIPVDASHPLPVTGGGGGGGGTSSSFNSAFPSTGTAVGALDSTGTNMVPLNLDPSGNLKVTNTGSLGTVTQGNAGSNAQAWWTRIGDATSGPAKVQVGSSAATGDTALTVTDPNVLAAVNSPIPSGTNPIGNAGSIFPIGATAVRGSATGTTAATAATLGATSGKTNYVCGISIRANATAAATGNATLSDGTSTLNFTQWTAPAASGLGVIEELFTPCRPASGTNVAWTLTSAAPGTGGVVSTTIWGYQN